MLSVWLLSLYWMVWPGLKRLGSFKDGDVVLGFAFGRNSVPDDQRHRIAEFLRLKCRGNDFLAIEGLRQDIDPGQPNRKIARAVEWLLAQNGISAVVQWEIAVAFHPDWFRMNLDRIKIIWPPSEPDRTCNAHDVLLMAESISECRWHRPIIVTHQQLLVRAILLARRRGHQPIVPPQRITGFDPRSVQPWTAHPLPWLWREGRARVHHWIHYWV